VADDLFILTVLALLIVAAEWLARRPGFRHLGSALLVILLGAIVANLGVIPAGSPPEAPVAVYEVVFAHVAPIAIFWLLLTVNLREVARAGLPLLALFGVGALATLGGAVLAMRLVGGAATIGPLYDAIAGMFTGTYTGGSINFNAVALAHDVMRDGTLYGGAVVVDNVVTTLWMVVTLALPRLLAAVWPRPAGAGARAPAAPIVDLDAETETLDPRKLALVVALGLGAHWLADRAADACAAAGVAVPSILILTTLALVLAQVPAVSRLAGARVLGMVAVYLFLAVIGAFCDLEALSELGRLGFALLAFATLTVLVHGAAVLATARLFRLDLAGAAVASQANIGGSTSALALAKSLGREDLLVPGILLGSIGNAVGTYLGFLAVALV
jgi:uncharacterized membrane protein